MREAQRLIDMDEVTQEAVYRAGTLGIIFIRMKIDKIAGKAVELSVDVIREGVAVQHFCRL